MSANDVLLPLEATKEECGQLSREELAMFDLVWSDRPDDSETSDLLSSGAGCSGSGGGSGEGSGEEIDLLGVDDDDDDDPGFHDDLSDVQRSLRKKRLGVYSPGLDDAFDAPSPSMAVGMNALGERQGISNIGRLHHPSPRSALSPSVTGQGSLMEDATMDIVGTLDIGEVTSAHKLGLGVSREHERLMRAASQLPETPKFAVRSEVSDNLDLLGTVVCSICQDSIAWAGDVDPIGVSDVDMDPQENSRSVYEELAPVLLVGCLLHQSCVRNALKKNLLKVAPEIDVSKMSKDDICSSTGPLANAVMSDAFTVLRGFVNGVGLDSIVELRHGELKRKESSDPVSMSRTVKRSKESLNSTRRDILDDINLEVDEIKTPVAGSVIREMNMSPQVSPSGGMSSNADLQDVDPVEDVGLVGSPGNLLLSDDLCVLGDPQSIVSSSARKILQRELGASEPAWRLNQKSVEQLPEWMKPSGTHDILGLLPSSPSQNAKECNGNKGVSTRRKKLEKLREETTSNDESPKPPHMQPVLRVRKGGELEGIAHALPVGDFHTFSIAHGPESSEWAIVSCDQHQKSLVQLVGDLETWSPDVGFCVRNNIPVVVGRQNAKDCVAFSPCNLQWVFELGTGYRATLDWAHCSSSLDTVRNLVKKYDTLENTKISRQTFFNLPVVSLLLETLHREVTQELGPQGLLHQSALQVGPTSSRRHAVIRRLRKLQHRNQLNTQRLAPIVPLPRNKPPPIPEKRSKTDNRLARSPFIAPVPSASLVNGEATLFSALCASADDDAATKCAESMTVIPARERFMPQLEMELLKFIVNRAKEELKAERACRSLLKTLDCEVVGEPSNSRVSHCEMPNCQKELVHHYFFCNSCNSSGQDSFFDTRGGKKGMGVGAQRGGAKGKKPGSAKRGGSRTGKSNSKKTADGSGTSSRKSREPMPAWLSIGNRVTVADSLRQGVVVASGHGFFTVQVDNGGTVLKRRKGLLPPSDFSGSASSTNNGAANAPNSANAMGSQQSNVATNSNHIGLKFENTSTSQESPRPASDPNLVGSQSESSPSEEKAILKFSSSSHHQHATVKVEGRWSVPRVVSSADSFASNLGNAGKTMKGNTGSEESTMSGTNTRCHPAVLCFDCWLQHLHSNADHAPSVICVERVNFEKFEQLVAFGEKLLSSRQVGRSEMKFDPSARTLGTASPPLVDGSDDRVYAAQDAELFRFYNHLDSPSATMGEALVSYRFEEPIQAPSGSVPAAKTRQELISSLFHPGHKQSLFPALSCTVSPFVVLSQPADKPIDTTKKAVGEGKGAKEPRVEQTQNEPTVSKEEGSRSEDCTSLNTLVKSESDTSQVMGKEPETTTAGSTKKNKGGNSDETAGGEEWSSCFLDRGSFCTFSASLNMENESFVHFPITPRVHF